MFTRVFLHQSNISSMLQVAIICCMWNVGNCVNCRRWRAIRCHPFQHCPEFYRSGPAVATRGPAIPRTHHLKNSSPDQEILEVSPSWREESPQENREGGCHSTILSLALYAGPRHSTCPVASHVTYPNKRNTKNRGSKTATMDFCYTTRSA